MKKTVEQRVLKFIDANKLIEKGDKILVALSGGADSVFLVHILSKYKRRLEIELSAFHLNHRLRGKDAANDQKYCEKFCKSNKLELFSAAKNVKSFASKNKISVEEAGRITRYSELQKVVNKEGFNKIATAHNSTDNAETVLLNLVKGTGLKGISGIPVERENIIRPILILSSGEIRKYLDEKRIGYRIDVSNLNDEYERNFIRNEILPKLKERINPKLENSLIKSSRIFRNLNKYLTEIIDTSIVSIVNIEKDKLEIDLSKLKKLDVSLRTEIFKRAIENNFSEEISSENVYDLESLIQKQPGKKIKLSDNLSVVRERDYLVVINARPGKTQKFNKQIQLGESEQINGSYLSIKRAARRISIRSSGKKKEYISGDGLSKVFHLRYWTEGDKFYPLGMNGSKKISDFLNEQKVPSHTKRRQMVLTNSGKIVWVVGYRIDNRFRVTNKTKQVFELCLVK